VTTGFYQMDLIRRTQISNYFPDHKVSRLSPD